MSIESKEIKDLHEIYQNLQEGPMSGAVLFDKKEKPIIIKLKNGGTKKIFPAHPEYAKYKSGEKTESGSDESRVKIDSSKGTDKTGSSDVSADKDLKDVSRDSSHTDASGKKHLSTAEIRDKNEKEGGSGMSNIDPKEGNAKINDKKINPDFGKETDINKETRIKQENKAKEDAAKAAWLNKTRNSPAAKSGAFSDDQRWATYQKHRKWQKDNNRGEFKVKDDPNTSNNEAREAAKKAAFERRNKRLTDKGLKPIVKKPIIKTDQASTDTTTTFDSNRIKDGNKGVKKIITKNEEFDAYDLVLNYLLETNQVDTIEEANYVMTQMDEATIQGIVNEYD